MRSKSATALSKFLSLILRHRPELIGLTLDSQGWANIEELLTGARAHGVPLTHARLVDLVAQSDKQRFAVSDDGQRIRAQQGHSLAIDLSLNPQTPPGRLFHGTATRSIHAIRREGLRPGQRQYVHLSASAATALNVGQRHGAPVVITVRALAMHDQGYPLLLTANGVWLTRSVPAEFLDLP